MTTERIWPYSGCSVKTPFMRGIVMKEVAPAPGWDATKYFLVRPDLKHDPLQRPHLVAGYEILEPDHARD